MNNIPVGKTYYLATRHLFPTRLSFQKATTAVYCEGSALPSSPGNNDPIWRTCDRATPARPQISSRSRFLLSLSVLSTVGSALAFGHSGVMHSGRRSEASFGMLTRTSVRAARRDSTSVLSRVVCADAALYSCTCRTRPLRRVATMWP